MGPVVGPVVRCILWLLGALAELEGLRGLDRLEIRGVVPLGVWLWVEDEGAGVDETMVGDFDGVLQK